MNGDALLAIALSDPLALYNLAEALARTRSETLAIWGTVPGLLLLPNLLQGSGHPQLLPTWQHYKAYASAFASWVKAYTKTLPEEALEVKVLAEPNPPVLVALEHAVMWLLKQPRECTSEIYCSTTDPEIFRERITWLNTAGPSEQNPSASGVQLLLLLWLPRGIAAAAEHLAGVTVAPSSRGVSRGGSKEGGSSSSSGLGLAAPGGRRYSLLQHVVKIALIHFHALGQWKDVAFSAAMTAVLGDLLGNSSIPGAAEAAAAAGLDTPSKPVPKRLSKLPYDGLPEAVVKQMQLVRMAWPCAVALDMNMPLPSDVEQQKQLLRELLVVFQMLEEEVPLPLGCSNPGCMELSGLSEVAAHFTKACSACKVVRYCCSKCQKQHWQVHKASCKRLQ